MKKLFSFLFFALFLTACSSVQEDSPLPSSPEPMIEIESGQDTPETMPEVFSEVEDEVVISDYVSCVVAGMETVVVGANETSVCTATDGRIFETQIPGIWAKENISSVTDFMACALGGLPVDRTNPDDVLCLMPDGRILRQNDSEMMNE